MPTTTIRIADELKARLAAAAERTGKTAHAFILEAIAQTIEQVEADEEFRVIAEKRWAKFLTKGEAISWDSAKTYLEGRARGERPRRPVSRKISR